MSLDPSKFVTGASAGEKRVAETRTRTSDRAKILILKDGESAIVRLLDEFEPIDGLSSWIIVDQHSYVPTRTAPGDWPKDSKWPQRMDAVCRANRSPDGSPIFGDGSCYLCDAGVKRSLRYYARAVLREEIKDGGRVVGFQDKVCEVKDKDGNVSTVPDVVLLRFGYTNFFSTLMGFVKRYGSALDRDYYIDRQGKEMNDTVYAVVPADPIQNYSTADPEIRQRYAMFDTLLTDEIERLASDHHYALWFDVTQPQPALKKKASEDGAPQANQGPAPTAEAATASMRDMAERVRSYGGASEAAPVGAGLRNFG